MSTFDDIRNFLDARDAAAAALTSQLRSKNSELESANAALEGLVTQTQADRDGYREKADQLQALTTQLQAEIDQLKARVRELEAGTGQPTEGLFFEMPARKTGDTLVLAHYFPVFPLSIENGDPATDYYARNWLAPNGEGGIHATYGGRLRDRPLTSAPYANNWRREAAAEEIRAAIKYGIDGFFVNLMSTAHANVYTALREEANANFPDFKIVPMVDTNGSMDNTQTTIVGVVSDFVNSKNALVLGNGAYAVASFKAEGRDSAWWSQLAADVKTRSGKTIDFIHVYNSGTIGTLPQYAAGIWGPGTDPVTVAAWSGTKTRADQLGVKSLYPVWPSDVRVKSGNSDEPRGFGGLRASWDKSVQARPAFVQMCTWDDLTEASQFKPTAMRGTALLEYSAYRIAELRTGEKPKVLKDAIFVSHRNQTLNARVTGGQTVPMRQWRSPIAGRGSTVTDGFRDEIEVVTFLTKAQRVTVVTGNNVVTTYDAPAGEFSKYIEAKAGEVSVTVGTLVFRSPITIRDTVVNQDRAYAYSSSLGTAPRQYDPTPK